MNPQRRATLALLALIGSSLLRPTRVLAAARRPAFDAATLAEAMKHLDAVSAPATSDIVLKVPDIAENAAIVPVDIVSNLPNTESISVLVDKNPHPLAARFRFAPGALPQVHVRLKMAQTSNIRVIVKAGGKTWQVAQEVKVTVGGCGA